MRELHLFAGAGGGILGGLLLGHRPVCAVEIEPYCRETLLQRQRDGILPRFPIWDDVTTFDGRSWKGQVDVVAGGFPCQDISIAGKGAGIDGGRSGLWSEMARIISEVMPRFVFVENSPALTFRGLGTVLRDLASMGYDARWGVLGASDIGGGHHRKRIWILAYPTPRRHKRRQSDRKAKEYSAYGVRNQNSLRCWVERSKEIEPLLERKLDGMANFLDRLKAIGNGQVPAVAATAFSILSEGLI